MVRVAIFPGHVGKDSGAVDTAAPAALDDLQTIEAVVTYAIASRVADTLSGMGVDNVLAVGGWDYRLARLLRSTIATLCLL